MNIFLMGLTISVVIGIVSYMVLELNSKDDSE